MRKAIVALAGLAACAGAGTRGMGALVRGEALTAEVDRVVRVWPAQPRVGDTVRIAALLVNRGAAPFAWTDACHDDSWNGSHLPLSPPLRAPYPPDPGDPLSPGNVVCLGITHRTLQPGDTAVLSERRWGPLTRPGTYPVTMALYYGPRATVDTLTVPVTVRPRR